jgi:hypothetical protein
MAKLKMKLDDGFMERMKKVAGIGGYSSVDEFVIHVLEREMEKLDPTKGESEESIKKKLEGLGYIS